MSAEGKEAGLDGAPAPSSRWWFWSIVAVNAAIGLAIRVSYAASQAGRGIGGDAFYYYWQARAVATGKGFLNPYLTPLAHRPIPGADHPPGFTLVLAFVQRIGFVSPQSNRYTMCVLGTVTIVLVAIVVKNLIGDRAAIIAAFLTAVYPQVWINDGQLMSETLYVFAFTLALVFVYRIWKHMTWRNIVGAAIALTIATSARPEAAALFPLILLPVILARSSADWGRRVGFLAVAAVIPIIAFAPWVIYNSHRFAKPVILSDQLGPTLLTTNCDATYYGEYFGGHTGACLIDFPGQFDASIIDIATRKRALHYMSTHKRRLPAVVAAREGRMWGVWRVEQQRVLDHFVEGRGSLTTVKWSHYSYWLLALIAIAAIPGWRRRRIPLYPMGCQVLLTAVIAGLTSGITRYRAAVEICIVILSASAIDDVLTRVRHRGTRSQPVDSTRAV